MSNNNIDINDKILCDTFIDVEEKHNTKIYDINKVLKKLENDGMRIKDYSYAIKHNILCITTAIKNNYNAISYIDKDYINNASCIKEIFIKSYLSQKENDPDEKYESYYPAYLYNEQIAEQINDELAYGTYKNYSDVIINIVKDLSDEDFEAFISEYPNLALSFIDENMSQSIANIINDNIIKSRIKK